VLLILIQKEGFIVCPDPGPKHLKDSTSFNNEEKNGF
jgi:hypothetical protein